MEGWGVEEHPRGHKAPGVNAHVSTQASDLKAIRNLNTMFDQTEVGGRTTAWPSSSQELTAPARDSGGAGLAAAPPGRRFADGASRAHAPAWNPPALGLSQTLLLGDLTGGQVMSPPAGPGVPRVGSIPAPGWGGLGLQRWGWVSWGGRCPGFSGRQAPRRVGVPQPDHHFHRSGQSAPRPEPRPRGGGGGGRPAPEPPRPRRLCVFGTGFPTSPPRLPFPLSFPLTEVPVEHPAISTRGGGGRRRRAGRGRRDPPPSAPPGSARAPACAAFVRHLPAARGRCVPARAVPRQIQISVDNRQWDFFFEQWFIFGGGDKEEGGREEAAVCLSSL